MRRDEGQPGRECDKEPAFAGQCQPTPRSLRLLSSARRLLVLASQRQARRLLSTLRRHTGERRRFWQGELALNRETAQNQTNSRQTKWILEGRANHQTLAQAAGTSEWKTLAELPEFAPILSSKYSAPLTGLAAPTLTADAVLARGVGVNIGDCLSRGWRLLVNNLPLFLGVSLVLLLIRFGLGFIPVIGPLVYWIIFGSLYGGFYMTFLKRVRGESAVIGDLFGGFSENFVQFMLAGLVMNLLTAIGMFFCVLPGIYLAVAWKFSLALMADRRMEFWPAMESSRRVITRYWFQIFGVLAVAYLPLILFSGYSVFHMLSVLFPLIINSGGRLDLSQVMKVAGEVVTLSLTQQLITLFALPFATAALMHAYEDLFGTRPAQTP